VSADDDNDHGETGLYLPLLHAHGDWNTKKLLVVAWQGKLHTHYVGVVPIKPGEGASQNAAAHTVKLTRECLPTAGGTVLVRGLRDVGGVAELGPLLGAESEALLQECFGETWKGGTGFLEVGGEQEKDLSRLLPVCLCVGCSGYDKLLGRGSTVAALK